MHALQQKPPALCPRALNLLMGAPQEELPPGVRVAAVGGGVATLRSGGEWLARLTLVPTPTRPPAPLPEPAAAAAAAPPDPATPAQGAAEPGAPARVRPEAAAAAGVKPEAAALPRHELGAAAHAAGRVPQPPPRAGEASGAGGDDGGAAPMDEDAGAAGASGGAGGAAKRAATARGECTDGAPGGGPDGGGGGGADGGRWRWRPLEMRVLPDLARAPLLPAAMMARLQARPPPCAATLALRQGLEGRPTRPPRTAWERRPARARRASAGSTRCRPRVCNWQPGLVVDRVATRVCRTPARPPPAT